MSKPKGWVRPRNPPPKQPSPEDAAKRAQNRLRTLSYFGCNAHAVTAAKKAAGAGGGGDGGGQAGVKMKGDAPKDPLLRDFYHKQVLAQQELDRQLAAQAQNQRLHDHDYYEEEEAYFEEAPPPPPPAAMSRQRPTSSHAQAAVRRRESPRRQNTTIRHQPLQRPMTRPVPTTSQRPGTTRIASHDERYERELRSRMVGSAAWSNAVTPLRL